MKVLTLNCRSLNNQIQRKLLFDEFLKFGVSCLQETYITNETAPAWIAQWSGQFFYVPGTPKSKGLIVLINRTLNCENVNHYVINDRCHIVNLTTNNKKFSFVNFYVPSLKEEREQFIKNLPDFNQYCDKDAFQIFLGDFNMVLNNMIDIISGHPHPLREVSCFKKFVEKYNLVDSFRYKFPNKKEYSWSQLRQTTNGSTFIARRLDYILISQGLCPFINNIQMIPFTGTDHKGVFLELKLISNQRGPGYWRFNDLLLENRDFISDMTDFIVSYLNNLKSEKIFNHRLIWDLLKTGIRDRCLSFVRNRKIEEWVDDLDLQIKDVSDKIAYNPTNNELLHKLNTLTSRKEIKELAQARYLIKKTKLKYIEQGEQPTKYFFNLEKARHAKQDIHEIYDENNVLLTTPPQILNRLTLFYKDLMNEPKELAIPFLDHDTFLEDFLQDINYPTIDNVEKNNLDQPFIKDDLLSGFKQLNKDSSPGLDGISPSFYLAFWDFLKEPFFKCVTEAFNEQCLSTSQQRSVITLLPKTKGEGLKDVKNWRPLSLTNIDYRCITRVLAQRVQTVISKLINNDQTAYIRSRSIHDNIRYTADLLRYVKTHDLPGMIVSLDYQKAFDRVSRSAIISALKFFNFGDNFINYVKTIINNTQSCVKNANWLSAFFTTDRGVRQGCCLSPLLFILVTELQAIKLRNLPSFEGILDNTSMIFRRERKLSQYADDMTLYAKNEPSLNAAMTTIDKFSVFSGLILNRKKCVGLMINQIGYVRNSNLEGITWINEDENIRILGTSYNLNIEASKIDENWDSKLEDIKQLIKKLVQTYDFYLGKESCF